MTAALMEHQSNRCGACGDLLRKFEKHHKQPVVAGGSDDINNLVLLCPACHASETEKQEQAVCRNNVWFESHLSPRMHKTFASLPLPQQIHWGEETARCKDDFSIVKCLDIVGCRSNFFYERTRDIPVGCPLDEFEPAYVDGVLRRPLTDFEWLWLDTLEQQDYSDGFQDMPDLHRLYDGPHLYPLEIFLVLIGAGFFRA